MTLLRAQTHLVMPLAAGVVQGPAAVPTLRALELAVRAKGHIDTGLTGTYFMCGALDWMQMLSAEWILVTLVRTQDQIAYGDAGVACSA